MAGALIGRNRSRRGLRYVAFRVQRHMRGRACILANRRERGKRPAAISAAARAGDRNRARPSQEAAGLDRQIWFLDEGARRGGTGPDRGHPEPNGGACRERRKRHHGH